MQSTAGLKKRSPFTFTSDEDNSLTDASILDDQQQEEVVQTLKKENDMSDRQIWLCLRIVMGCFAFLHILYLFRRVNPLGPFLSTSPPPRIPLDVLFTLLHTVILLGLAALPQYDDNTPGIHTLVPKYARIYAVAAIAPAYCSLTRQSVANIAWWGFALVAAALHHFFHSLIRHGKKDISQLEALKYDARGA